MTGIDIRWSDTLPNAWREDHGGRTPETPWARKRREKRAAHKAVRREWTAANEE